METGKTAGDCIVKPMLAAIGSAALFAFGINHGGGVFENNDQRRNALRPDRRCAASLVSASSTRAYPESELRTLEDEGTHRPSRDRLWVGLQG